MIHRSERSHGAPEGWVGSRPLMVAALGTAMLIELISGAACGSAPTRESAVPASVEARSLREKGRRDLDDSLVLEHPPWLDELRALPGAAEHARAASESDEPGDDAPAETDRAFLPLAAAIDELASGLKAASGTDEGNASDSPPETSEGEALRRVARLYVRGVRRLLEDDPAGAEALAREALELDADAHELHALLGRALVDQDRPSTALEHLKRAIEHGSRDPRVLWRAANEAEASVDRRTRARWLAAAARSPGRRADPGFDHLVLVDLGEDLLELGYLSAGYDALSVGFDLPRQFTVRTSYERELRSLSARAPELFLRMGDAACRLARYKDAVDVYTRLAGGARSELPLALEDRLVYALAAAGEVERAASRLVDRAGRSDGLLDERLVKLTEHICVRRRDVGRHVRDALPAPPDAAETSPAVRAWWDRLRAAAMSDGSAFLLLARAVRTDPDDLDSALMLMRRARHADGVAGMVDAAAQVVTDDDAVGGVLARAISSLMPDADPAIDALRARGSPGARRLAARLLLTEGRARDAARALESERVPREQARAGAWGEVLRVEVGVATGAWDEVGRAIQRLRDRDARDENASAFALPVVDALIASQRPDEALEAVRRVLERDPSDPSGSVDRIRTIRLLRRMALIGDRFGRSELVSRAHERILELDRFEVASLGWMATRGGSIERIKREPIIQRLRDQAPRSRLTRVLRAREFASRENWSAAESEAASLAEEEPWNRAPVELLVSIWTRSGGTDREIRLRRGLRWLEQQLEERPGDASLARAKAELLRAIGDAERADAFLASFRDEHDSRRVARLHERVVRSMLGDADRADEMAWRRLEAAAPSIETVIERAWRLASENRLEEASSLFTSSIPRTIELTTDQRSRAIRVLGAASQQVARERTPEQRTAALALMDRAESIGVTIPLQIAQLRVALLSLSDPPAIERIRRAISSAPTQSADHAAALRAATARELVRAGRTENALRLYGTLVAEAGDRTPTDVLAWMQLIAEVGDADDARELSQAVRDPEEIARVLREAFGPEVEVPAAADRRRAEMVYHLANLLSARGREEAGERVLRLALEIDPRHPWAANNLGYQLAEEGRDLAEAERLIEVAYEQMPDRSSIIDSLGWIRYRMGQIEDVTNDDGSIKREGALTLLRRAVEVDDRESPALLDHLGDALWRVDQREDAIERWSRAQELLTARLERARDGNESAADTPRVRRLRTQLERVQAKLRAAESGDRPPVAEVIGRPAHR